MSASTEGDLSVPSFKHRHKRTRRYRSARAYQDQKAPLRRIANAGVRSIAPAAKQALKQLPRFFDARHARFLAHTHPRQIGEAIDWHHFRETMKHVFERSARVYEAGAHLGARKINGVFASAGRKVRFRKETASDTWAPFAIGETGVIGAQASEADVILIECLAIVNEQTTSVQKAIGDRFEFDRFDEDVQAKLRAAQDDLIQGLEAGARDTIEAVISSGVKSGLSPDEFVGQIRDVISLTDRQALAVLNYRSMVEGLDSDALRRQLRDGNFDAALADAIENGKSLEDAIVDDMVDAYQSNYLDYRANTIAQTEATRMSNVGMQDAYTQAIDRGALPAEAVRQFWQVALDEKTCAICLSIPDMNEDGVAIGDDFESEDGPQGSPPDPHPSCRCSIEIVTDLDLVPDDSSQDEEAA